MAGVERREEILLFLKARGRASLGEVAEHLRLSKQAALRHLEALDLQGLVVYKSEERAGPGRPEHVYSLTAAAVEHFPQSHRQLAAELVQFIPGDELARFFEHRAARIEAEYAPLLAGLGPVERVHELARLATAHGHMAEVVEGEDGSLAIRQCNCPIADVAAATGHPCRLEAEMYSRLLDAEVTRTSWIADSATACTYVVKTK
jgi:predicted ArsR family transcriptional regulator